ALRPRRIREQSAELQGNMLFSSSRMLKPLRWRSFEVLASMLAMSGLGLAQSTWYIDASAAPPGNGTAQNPYASIQYAIAQPSTVAGDLLLAAPGVYVETVRISKAVTLRSSAGPLATILRAAAPGNVVTLES